MKILVVHNFHRTGSASGDDQVFRNEVRLLKEQGHQVIEYTVNNDAFDKKNAIGKIKDTLGMLWSFRNYNAIKEIIHKENPELMHVHTYFPLLSPSIYYAAKRSNCKVVQTLHDTRLVCPPATSLRQGKICQLCCDGKFFRMIKYNCFKNSKSMSAIVAVIFWFHRISRTFYKKIDTYICLNDDQMQLLRQAGFNDRQMYKKYNFTEIKISGNRNGNSANSLPKRYVVFYGRIGEEKGIEFLCNSWEHLSDIPLVIMGDGPLREELSYWIANKENIYYLGYVKHDQCISIASGAEFVVFTSIWYEGCSMVVIEAESLGKPLVATDMGFAAEAITDNVNGLKFKPGDKEDFARKVRMLWNDTELIRKLSENAILDYHAKYTPEKNINQLLKIYRDTLERQ